MYVHIHTDDNQLKNVKIIKQNIFKTLKLENTQSPPINTRDP